jgi:hypothetical protein
LRFFRAPILFSLTLAAVAPAKAGGQTPRRALLRQMYGDVAIEVWQVTANALHIGAADARRVLSISVVPRDLRRWTDSAGRILTARAQRREVESRWRAIVEEPGVQGGSMSLLRTINGADTTISLFIADGQFEGVRTPLDPDEARALVSAMRRAADAALAPARGRTTAPTTKRPPPKPQGD